MLRKKIAIDYWTNKEFTNLDTHEIAQYTLYLAGFAKILIKLDFDSLKKTINIVKNRQLTPLPPTPSEIPESIITNLPFTLPITDLRKIRAIVASLRNVYTFERLPSEYIADKRTPLPSYPSQLNEETCKLFPITTRAELQNLKNYKQYLQTHYLFKTIPPEYFDLPPPKSPLPPTPQLLTPRLRRIFPFHPKDSDDFKEHIKILREEYAFLTLPNDYLISKRRLPEDPSQLTLAEQINFPIEKMDDVHQFYQNIPTYYHLPDPLPLKYVNFNYTERLNLPQDSDLIYEVNLTLPIATPKELLTAARALRKFYYFHTIPDEWIDIPKKKTSETTSDNRQIPNNNEDLNNILKTKEPSTNIQFPITDQSYIPQAIEIIKQHFDCNNIPNFLFAVNDLPPPQWNIFDNSHTTTTINNLSQDISMEENDKLNSNE